MGLFDNMLSNDETLFKDESVLDFDFVPDSITNREKEMNTIVSIIKPLFADKRAGNLFITGVPGIGKTLTIKHVFKELNKSTEDIVSCYINNWKFSTTHSIFVELSRFFGVPFPRKGVSTDEIVKNIIKKADSKKGVVICFDEIDKARELDFIYPLIEGFGKRISIILISNYGDFLSKVDSRLISRLNLEILNFKGYSLSQIKDILIERINFAFFPNVFEDNALDLIANFSEEKNDLRVGINLLLKSGRIAENDASRKVLYKHVLKSIESIKTNIINVKNESLIKELDSKKNFILELIKNNEGIITGELFNMFLEKGNEISIRTFRKYLNHLETLEFIRTEETGEGFRGKSRRLYLRK